MHVPPQKFTHSAKGDWLWRLNFAVARLTDRYIPAQLLEDPETARRARLIMHFGVLGSAFGFSYAAFYLLIGHYWGAAIVGLCTAGVALTPLLMQWYKDINPAGNFFSLVLVLGFFGLCLCEGGLDGHAIAWLVSVPLCAMLLLGVDAAIKWVIISVITATLVAGLTLAGFDLHPTYEPRWHGLVSTAGYVGLIAFMSTLGVIFERGRVKAQARMQAALQRLAESNQKLVVMNSEKNEFLGIAAHDLKNPLTSVLVNADLMRTVGDPRQVRYADKIVASAETMRNLITDLLDVHAIEEGRFASKLEPCDLAALLSDCLESNNANAVHKQIELRTGMFLPVIVQTDRTAARQILDNLISNAVKYSPHGSTVRVDLVTEGGRAIIHIRDQGPGLSEEDQKNLFKKFARLSSKPTGGESSNGLGLAIAHRLANALSGALRCESKLGEGSTFSFELPLPPQGSLVLPLADALNQPNITKSGQVSITSRPVPYAGSEPPAPQPSTSAPPSPPSVAMPPPPRHRIAPPPAPVAQKGETHSPSPGAIPKAA